MYSLSTITTDRNPPTMSSEDPLATQQQGLITSCCTENEPAIHQEPTQQHGEVRAGKRSRDLEGEIDGPASKKANYDTTDGSRRVRKNFCLGIDH